MPVTAIPSVPYGTVAIDEQAAVIAATITRIHPDTYPAVAVGAPAWCAIDALRRRDGEWLTWGQWLTETATALALAGHHPAGAEQACRDASILVHETPDGRAAGLYEIEDRARATDPWRVRARRIARVWHPPLLSARYQPAGEPRRRAHTPAAAAAMQLSLLEAA